MMSSSNATQTIGKAVKVEWQNRVASLYWRVLGEFHLLGRWIPVEELALMKLDFLPLFKARFVDKVYRAPLVGGTEAWVDFVIVNAEYNCVNSPDGTFSRFNKRPRQLVYVTHCASGGEVGLLMPGAPRHLVELTGPAQAPLAETTLQRRGRTSRPSGHCCRSVPKPSSVAAAAAAAAASRPSRHGPCRSRRKGWRSSVLAVYSSMRALRPPRTSMAETHPLATSTPRRRLRQRRRRRRLLLRPRRCHHLLQLHPQQRRRRQQQLQ
jgi:hypothetical protein